MYIRKGTILIMGIAIAGFIAGNVILMVKEHKSGKKMSLRSVVDLLRETKSAYNRETY